MKIGQMKVTGHPQTAPSERTHSVQNDPELINTKSVRMAHPNTVLQLASGNLRSPGRCGSMMPSVWPRWPALTGSAVSRSRSPAIPTRLIATPYQPAPTIERLATCRARVAGSRRHGFFVGTVMDESWSHSPRHFRRRGTAFLFHRHAPRNHGGGSSHLRSPTRGEAQPYPQESRTLLDIDAIIHVFSSRQAQETLRDLDDAHRN